LRIKLQGDDKKLVRHPRCLCKEEQEKNGAAGFNAVDAISADSGTGRQERASKESRKQSEAQREHQARMRGTDRTQQKM
jgi:hypothetical protein